ncbi:MAG: hypothetical protein J4428_04970 [Candidatus Aenigmarchaeota archaeon]|nr:hypothetical protein [Candidatus Aenigmarchaeota archaeon]
MLLVKFMSLLDLIAGFFLISSTDIPIIKFFIYYSFIKGIVSIISSIALGYYYDWMGLTDLLTGIGLFFLSSGLPFAVFKLIGYVTILKAIYAVFTG